MKNLKKNYYMAGCLVVSLVIVALGIVSVLGIKKVISTSPRSFSVVPIEPPPVDQYTLSIEQQSLLDQFGYPDAFTIQFYREEQPDRSKQDMRLEIWTYYEAGQEVTLLNGQVIDQSGIDPILSALAPIPYRPEQFTASMDSTSALRAAGLQEYIQAPLETEDIHGGTLFFGQQIAFGFQGDDLLYVEGFVLEEVQP